MARLGNTASWLLAGTVLLVTVAWTNLTGLGFGTQPLTYDDIALPRFAVALIGVTGAWLVLAIMATRGFKLCWDITWGLIAALATWSVVSGIFANTTLVWFGQSERLEGVVTVVLYALLYGAGLQVGGSRQSVRMIAVALVVGSVVLSVHGLLQVAELDRTNFLAGSYSLYLGSAFASLGNPNFLAGVLTIALPVGVGLALTARSRFARALWWACSAIMLGALYATYSQGAWLAVLVQISAGIALWLWSRQARKRGVAEDAPRRSFARVALPAVAVLIVGVLVIVAATTIATQRGLRLWGGSITQSGYGRVLHLQTTADAIAERPVLGYGADNFLSAHRIHRPARYSEVFAQSNNNAHSWVAQYGATLGIPGAVLLASALFLGLVRIRPRSLGSDEPIDVFAAAIWLGLIGYVVQMMFNVAVLASTVPFWLLMGALSAGYAKRIELPTWVGRSLVGASALLVAGAVVISGALLAADSAFLSSRLAYNGDAPGDPVEFAQRAVTLNPLSVKYSRALAQPRVALVVSAIDQQYGAEEVLTLHRQADAALRDTLALAPNDYAALSWLAGLEASTGVYVGDQQLISRARQAAQRAAALDVVHESVAGLLEGGEISRPAARAALLEPGLP